MFKRKKGLESDEPTNDIVIGGNSKNPFSDKKLIVLIAILVILVLLVGGVVWHESSKKPVASNNQQPVCSSALLKQASLTILKPGTALPPQTTVANNILKLPNYQSDPKCLYVLVSYYINISDAKNASTDLSKLEAIHNSNQSNSQYINTVTISTLQSDIALMQKYSQQNKLTLSKQP